VSSRTARAIKRNPVSKNQKKKKKKPKKKKKKKKNPNSSVLIFAEKYDTAEVLSKEMTLRWDSTWGDWAWILC
jgi:hypothetical protein